MPPTPQTRLGSAVVPATEDTLTHSNVTSYRAVSTHEATGDSLGPLRDLPGHWQGDGFNLIARPDSDPANEDGVFLELNLLRETIDITTIGSPTPNRGLQEDSFLFGVTYVQRVTDATTGGALHIEPGLFMTVPPSRMPDQPETIARLGNVPHGNSFCAVGQAEELDVDGTFTIPPTPTVPFPAGAEQPPVGTPNPFRVYDLSLESRFRTTPLPPEITQELVDNPARYNQAKLEGHTIKHMTVLPTSTANAGGIGNIPFVQANANAVHFDSVFAIQHVVGPRGTEFLQLQYTQTAWLEFRGMRFPHVSAATMIKAF